MTEKSLWRYLSRNMRDHWQASRHEDYVTPGIPDISFGINGTNGWLELKVLAAWPRDPCKLVDVRLNEAQKIWLISRGKKGGCCFILVQVKKEYLLFSWHQAKRMNLMTQDEMLDSCVGYWRNKVDWSQFIGVIKCG